MRESRYERGYRGLASHLDSLGISLEYVKLATRAIKKASVGLWEDLIPTPKQRPFFGREVVTAREVVETMHLDGFVQGRNEL